MIDLFYELDGLLPCSLSIWKSGDDLFGDFSPEGLDAAGVVVGTARRLYWRMRAAGRELFRQRIAQFPLSKNEIKKLVSPGYQEEEQRAASLLRECDSEA